MPDYIVCAPFSGQVIALNCYCYRRADSNCVCQTNYCQNLTNCATCSTCYCQNCCYHPIVGTSSGYCCPMDVSATVNTWIYAYLSANIMSVKILYASNEGIVICTNNSGASGPITQGVILEVWTGLNATGKRLGRLLYAHVKNIVHPHGTVINRSGSSFPWYVSIGQVPEVPQGQTCYLSPHTHFSIWADTGVARTRNSFVCGQNVSAAATPIYWWTY